MAEEQKVVTPEVTEKAPEQATKAPRENKGNRKPNGKGPRKFNKGAKREEKLYEERVVAINRVSLNSFDTACRGERTVSLS